MKETELTNSSSLNIKIIKSVFEDVHCRQETKGRFENRRSDRSVNFYQDGKVGKKISV